MNEMGLSGEEGQDFIIPPAGEAGAEKEGREPTPAELIRFVREVYGDHLDENTLESIEEEFRDDYDDACGYLLSVLLENGIDQDEYFRTRLEKGIDLPR